MRHVLKAVIRIEKKLDELLKLVVPMAQKPGTAVPPLPQPLHIPNQGACPLCQQPVSYQNLVDPQSGEVVPVRLCGCEPVVVNIQPGA